MADHSDCDLGCIRLVALIAADTRLALHAAGCIRLVVGFAVARNRFAVVLIAGCFGLEVSRQ